MISCSLALTCEAATVEASDDLVVAMTDGVAYASTPSTAVLTCVVVNRSRADTESVDQRLKQLVVGLVAAAEHKPTVLAEIGCVGVGYAG